MAEAEDSGVVPGLPSGAVPPLPVRMWARYVEAAWNAYDDMVYEAWRTGVITGEEKDRLLAEERRVNGESR